MESAGIVALGVALDVINEDPVNRFAPLLMPSIRELGNRLLDFAASTMEREPERTRADAGLRVLLHAILTLADMRSTESDAMTLLQRIWQSPWLPKISPVNLRLVVTAILALLRPASGSLIENTTTTRVEHLLDVDMAQADARQSSSQPQPDTASAANSTFTSSAPNQPENATAASARASASPANDIRSTLFPRIMVLLDEMPDSCQDLVPLFALLDQACGPAVVASATKVVDGPPANGLKGRLLVLVALMSASDSSQDQGDVERLLLQVPIDSSGLFLAETFIALSDRIPETKFGESSRIVTFQPDHAFLKRYQSSALDLIAGDDGDDRVASIRLLCLLSRHISLDPEDWKAVIMPAFKKEGFPYAECFPYLAMLARQTMEDDATLSSVLRFEMLQNMSDRKDVAQLARGSRTWAAWNFAAFLDTVEAEYLLVNPKPDQTLFELRRKTEQFEPENESVTIEPHWLIDHLTDELDSVPHDSPVATVLLALLTELLGSYNSAKGAYLAHFPDRRNRFNAFLKEFVGGVDLDAMPTVLRSKRATAMLVALCSPATGTSPGLATVRKFVVDGLIKALNQDFRARTDQGRFWAYANLTNQLLTNASRDTVLLIAKMMLERSLVPIFIRAISEIDVTTRRGPRIVDLGLQAVETL